jgi:hypothetical protein
MKSDPRLIIERTIIELSIIDIIQLYFYQSPLNTSCYQIPDKPSI